MSGCVQDAHRVLQPKMPRGRKKRFGPLETKQTVTSVAWLPGSHVVASSGSLSCHATAWNSACFISGAPTLPGNMA